MRIGVVRIAAGSAVAFFLRPEGVKSLKRANQYTAGCPRYLGRTNSYLEFGEADEPAVL